jgi:Predicted pyridoxal phosphate-dependent enzyme apparently involved in regulation of cell wall biogenesis
MNQKLSWGDPNLSGKEREYLLDAIDSERISHGPYVEKLENYFSTYLNCPAISCCNGTIALQMAYLALGIGPGDEVIIPAFSFASAANMACVLGAKPILCDVNSNDWTIDSEKIEKLITQKTKALVCIHLFGVPCNMEKIKKICEERKIFLIEDCAQGLFSKFYKKPLGDLWRCFNL